MGSCQNDLDANDSATNELDASTNGPPSARANGTIRCRISAEDGVDTVIFTPDQTIKDGKREFVAFVPKEDELGGFVVELPNNGSIDLAPDRLSRSTDVLLRAALCNTKVTVVVCRPSKPECPPKLQELVVPAERVK